MISHGRLPVNASIEEPELEYDAGAEGRFKIPIRPTRARGTGVRRERGRVEGPCSGVCAPALTRLIRLYRQTQPESAEDGG